VIPKQTVKRDLKKSGLVNYRLSLELEPENIALGWVIGGGRRDLKDQGVNYLLTLEKTKHHISGRHARVVHHSESGALMIVVDRGTTVPVNGQERIEEARRAIVSVRTGLSFGDLAYQLEFTELNEARYREQLKSLRSHLPYGLSEPPVSLEITPSENYFEYHGFFIQTPFESGAYGIVSSGMEHSTGKAVAVKRLKRNPESVARIQLEVKIYKELRHTCEWNHFWRTSPGFLRLQPNLCHLMADIYSGGDEAWTGRSKINDVYLIHSPLANKSFVALTGSRSPYEVWISAFHQILKGVAHLHRHGIMHRDIKPTNLMIVSYNPIHAIIIDYGSATFEETSTDHYSGTIAYLAPEVLQLKRNNGVGESYNRLVDIWSLGLSGHQLSFQASYD
jgi:Protein kinase domain